MDSRTSSASKGYGAGCLKWGCGFIHVVGWRMMMNGVWESDGDGGIILMWRKLNDRRRT